MNILAFDTCFGACSAAIGLGIGGPDERIVWRFEIMDTGHAERLIPMIGEVLDEACLSMSEIDQMGVTIGPGSFTGSRIGVATARAFALAMDVQVTGLSSLAVMARQVAQMEHPLEDICIAVDVRRGEVYTQLFDCNGFLAKSEPEVKTLSDAKLMGQPDGCLYFGSGAVLITSSNDPASMQLKQWPDLKPDARYAIALLSRNRQSTRAISPLYLRPPDAKPPASNNLQRQ